MNDMQRAVQKEFEEEVDQQNSLVKKAENHKVFGKVLKINNAPFTPKLVSKFIECAMDIVSEHYAAGRWADNFTYKTSNEGIWKGFRIKLALDGGFGKGLFKPLSRALIKNGYMPDYCFAFTVLEPLMFAYKTNVRSLDLEGGMKEIAEGKLIKIDTDNKAIISFLQDAIKQRPGLLQHALSVAEMARRCAYSVPGRMTPYHADLAELVMKSPQADRCLNEMSGLYRACNALGLGVKTQPCRRDLSVKLLDRFGKSILEKRGL